MYKRYYGLNERPFELTPDPRYLLMTPKHKEALNILQYGISERKGVTIVLGPAGTGKTTLIHAALASFREGTLRYACLNNPTLTRDELVETLARAFDLGEDAAHSKATLLAKLEACLKERRAAGIITALIVDEAQALPDALLEEIRLLVNIESDTDKLLPVVLVGQQEFADRLNQPSYAAVKQRIALRCDLGHLTPLETAQYIATRIRIAGGVPSHLFTREAVDLIHERSQGIPRTISVVCDNALVTGFAMDQRPVGRQLILEVCRDFDLQQAADQSRARPASRPEPDLSLAEKRSLPRSDAAAPALSVTAPAAPRPVTALSGGFERTQRS